MSFATRETELPSLEVLEVPRFVTMENKATAATREFVSLWQSVLQDPTGFSIVHDRSTWLEQRVPFHTSPHIRLQALLGRLIDTEPDPEPDSFYIQVGVIMPDGSAMYLGIEERRLPEYDVQKDPFASLILDYFRTHVHDRATSQ